MLGNFRLRKLYDKGIIHTAEETHQKYEEPPKEDDPTTRFYKARMNKEQRTATGRTPIYNFDEWNEQHYGREFKRQQKLKHNFEEKITKTETSKHSIQNELMLVFIMVFILILSFRKRSYDVDNSKTMKGSKPGDSK